MIAHNRLAAAAWEADQHVRVLIESLADWHRQPAPDLPTLETDRNKVRLVDQVLFRFIKLQDVMGERLVPATLDALAEPCETLSMRDRLNRLEKLGFVDVDVWLAWRDVRNRLAHEYPDHPELRYAALLAAIQAAQELGALYAAWRRHLHAQRLLPGDTP